MTLTKGSFTAGDGPKPSSKNIIGSEAGGTGKYGADLSSAAGDSDGSADDAMARAVYGDPPSGTRMDRIESIAEEALECSSGDGAASSVSEAFIDGSTVGGFTGTSGLQRSGAAGSPGFPGLPDTPTSQGENIKVTEQVAKSGSNPGSNPAVKGYPGFPGLP